MAYLVHIDNLAVDDLALERLHNNRRVRTLEAGLASAGHDLALANVVDRYNRDNVAGIVRSSSLIV
jgi:hypothetical protein